MMLKKHWQSHVINVINVWYKTSLHSMSLTCTLMVCVVSVLLAKKIYTSVTRAIIHTKTYWNSGATLSMQPSRRHLLHRHHTFFNKTVPRHIHYKSPAVLVRLKSCLQKRMWGFRNNNSTLLLRSERGGNTCISWLTSLYETVLCDNNLKKDKKWF